MAYICGIVTKEEKEILQSRGWDLEDAPAELVPADCKYNKEDFIMIWVDSSLFDIMDGPDWEKGTEE